ncbi:alpha-glucosidase family protein [Uliginosibacterium gangwonense]|uniref:alpha-glucosidase family protein n=1 Tax=Uliginosibacterium gangwonense TaxID=392736 RepID=UPI000372BAC0|nr:alpha-glucosidase family protein [Uliginosibacterium gangwonense]
MSVSVQRDEWWRGASIYQIYPRSFCDSNKDGVGDLPGIIARLPYVAALGVDAIWISPFFRSPMKDFGYDVSDYCDVDPLFGSLADFDALVTRAHELGLKVVIDQVLSHTSEAHPWFKQSRQGRDNPYADWYVWQDPKPDGSPPNNWLSVFGGVAWQWDSRRCQYYLHNFLTSQPDLNFYNPAVQDAMLETVRFWCKRGVDGFRFDACNFHFHDKELRNNPPFLMDGEVRTAIPQNNPYGMQIHAYDKTQAQNLAFLKRLRVLLDEYKVASVGEIGDEDGVRVMAEYTAHGDKLHMAYSFTFLTDAFSAEHIRTEVENFEARINPVKGWGCWAFSNHDAQRVMTRWGHMLKTPAEKAAFAKLLFAVIGSLRGSFCVYQGEELGLEDAEVPFDRLRDPYGIAFWPDYKGRDGCRTPMPWTVQGEGAGFSTHEPWLPIPQAHQVQAVDAQAAQPDSVLNFYRGFLAWRRNLPVLAKGDIRFMTSPDSVLCFMRSMDRQEVFCAFNLSPEAVEYVVPMPLAALTGHGLGGAEIDVCDAQTKLVLPAWSGFFGKPLAAAD